MAAPCGLWDGNVTWFICWFRHCINCLFVYLISFLPFFLLPYFFLFLCFLPNLFTFFLVYFMTYLSTSYRIRPFHFQARGRRRRPNVALVYWVHFVLWYIMLWMHVCFCCVWYSFSLLRQEIGWEEHLRNDLFCVGLNVKHLTQSVVTWHCTACYCLFVVNI